MAKPRRRRRTSIPSIQPRSRRGKAGQARDTHVLRETQVTDEDGTTRDVGSGDGRGGYGPNRLHGQAQSRAIAGAKKEYSAARIRRMQEYAETGDISAYLYYRTNTINPGRPRTKLAGYDGRSKTIQILFRYKEDPHSLDGAIYEYYGVDYGTWRKVKRNVSTGRTINRTLNNFPYAMVRPPAP